MKTPPVILSIAGFDPSSGAGITSDVKTAAAHGCFAATCITALTVQSTRGVRRVEPVPAEVVRETLEELASDLQIAAVRIGMLATARVARTVAEFLIASKLPNVVLDPIVSSSSGYDLLGPGGLEVVRDALVPLSTVVTPNIDEAAALTGFSVTNTAQMAAAGSRLVELGAKNVVVTGGHLEEAVDVLVSQQMLDSHLEATEFRGAKLASSATHGTGCAFATSVACGLALGKGVAQAVSDAKAYVAAALAAAYPLGHGHGPLNHLFGLRSK